MVPGLGMAWCGVVWCGAKWRSFLGIVVSGDGGVYTGPGLRSLELPVVVVEAAAVEPSGLIYPTRPFIASSRRRVPGSALLLLNDSNINDLRDPLTVVYLVF